MRTSPAGQKGRFSCDRCRKPSPRGVYTGVPGFMHVCPPCREIVAKKGGTTASAAILERFSKPSMAQEGRA